MKYLSTILLCLGVSRSGWGQNYPSCGCPPTSIQILSPLTSCYGNTGNGVPQLGDSCGLPGSCGANLCNNCGFGCCGSPYSQPVNYCLPPIISIPQPISSCYSSPAIQPAGSCGCGSAIQPISSCGSGPTTQPISSCGCGPTTQPISSCGCGPTTQPISSCGCGPTTQPISSCGCVPPLQPLNPCCSGPVIPIGSGCASSFIPLSPTFATTLYQLLSAFPCSNNYLQCNYPSGNQFGSPSPCYYGCSGPVTPAFSPCYYASLYQTVLGPTPCQTTTGPECDQGEPDSCSSGPSNSGPSCLNFPGPIRPDTCNSYNCQLPGVPVCDPYSCVPWAQPPCPYKSACPNAKRRGPKSEPFVKISKSEGQIQKMRQMTNDKAERFTAEPVKIRNAESCKNKSNERNSRYSYD